MTNYIRQFSAECSLGQNLDICVGALLQGQSTPTELCINDLRDPVRMPYFACAATPGADLYQRLERQLAGLLDAAGLTPTTRRRTALLLGSSSFDVPVSEARYRQDLQTRGPDNALPMPIIGYNKLAARLASALGLSVHHYTYSTACTSSANALLYADRLLTAGLVDHALVLGTEVCNHTTALGFYGLGLIATGDAMRPFDRDRDGLILGEAIAGALLSGEQHTPAAERRWQLAGGAIGTDNHSLTAADTEGGELGRVILAALADSGISARDITAIKAHGTASLKNDEAEAAALRRVFGENPPPVFALKPYTGHTLGASGALETALTLGALARGQLPANPAAHADAALGIHLAPATLTSKPGYYLFNCFAFGGNNNVLIIRDQGPAGADS